MEKKKFQWNRENFRSATQNLRPAILLVWSADPWAFSSLMLITLLSSALPVSQALVGRWIVDSVLSAANDGVTAEVGFWRVGPYLLGEFGLIFAGLLLGQIRKYVAEIQNQKLSQTVATLIMETASRLDIRYFETPAFLDKLQSARQETKFRAMGLTNAAFLLLQNILTIGSFVAPIFYFSPWIAVALFCSTLPAFVVQGYYSRLTFRLHSWRAPEGRMMNYYEHILSNDSAAKEIRIFQLARSLIKRHAELFSRVFLEDRKLAIRKSFTSVFWGSISALSFYGCYAWIIIKAVTRAISIGQMTFYLTSFRQLQGTFSGLFDNINSIYENGLFMQNLFAVLDAPTKKSNDDNAGDFEFNVAAGIEFRDVSFRYPNQEAYALKNFNLVIKPGQTIALVGENGSGKTTFIKLLTRLYDPTEGEIMLFGRPLASFPDKVLYGLFGAIFQDFVQYQASARDNVVFGAVEAVGNEERLARAAKRGGSDEFISELPEGWDTMLGGWFNKGRQLSGGQWQRLAVSRAFMRDAEVLILDEPTSSLDAQNEQLVFSRLKEMSDGKITFLVSHRFSTVRMADQILLLNHGTVEESGTHAELMQKNGSYAKLFELQAKGYR